MWLYGAVRAGTRWRSVVQYERVYVILFGSVQNETVKPVGGGAMWQRANLGGARHTVHTRDSVGREVAGGCERWVGGCCEGVRGCFSVER